MSNKLKQLRRIYPDYTFLYHLLPRPEKIRRPTIEDMIRADSRMIIVNPAEDAMYVDLRATDRMRVVWPGFNKAAYFFINYAFVQEEGVEARIFSLVPKAGNSLELGRVDFEGNSCYQVKVCDDPLDQFMDKADIPADIKPKVALMERAESYLRARIPEYFSMPENKSWFEKLKAFIRIINKP
jgi:hypothetical protein